MARFAERHLGLTTLTAIIVVAALTLATGATTLGVIALTAVSDQSQKSCEVQSRGLQATKEIVPVWAAINFLVQPHPGVRVAPVAPLFRASVNELRFHLPRYLRLQRMQPAGRSC